MASDSMANGARQPSGSPMTLPKMNPDAAERPRAQAVHSLSIRRARSARCRRPQGHGRTPGRREWGGGRGLAVGGAAWAADGVGRREACRRQLGSS